ncbi:MAG TPA: hypothetical protein VGM47_05955 [Gammaproteobacteria bacterium]|jgi:hypothetical protein
MNTSLRILPLLFGAACLTATVSFADARTDAYAHSDDDGVHVDVMEHDGIDIVDGDVVITADDGSVARIGPTGDLSIRGKTVSVTPEQRKLLQRYALGVRDIQERGLEIGQHAVQMVGGMLGTLASALFEDGDAADNDKDLDQKMKAKAEPLKEEARALCKDVKSEKQVQDQIASALPAFQPYALIEPHPEHSCHIDGDEV